MSVPAAVAWTRVALAAWSALVVLQLAWHGWLAPPEAVPRGWVVAFATVPLLLPLFAWRRGLGRALLLASVVALAYFCHGVMEAWAAPEVRGLALAEVALSVALVAATGTIGLLGRRAMRRQPRGD